MYSVTWPVLRSVIRTHGICCRCVSVAMYSMRLLMFMCQWMPPVRGVPGRPPPILTSRSISHRVFCASGQEMHEALELRVEEVFRPVALLAGRLGGTQAGNRSPDRARILVEQNRVHLIQPAELGLHVPIRARADVAVDALDARVG